MNIRATEDKQRSGKEIKYTWLYTYVYSIINRNYSSNIHNNVSLIDHELKKDTDYKVIINLINQQLNEAGSSNLRRRITLINWKKVIKDES